MYNRYVRNDRGVYTRIPEDIHPNIKESPPQAQDETSGPAPQTRPDASGAASQARDETPRLKHEKPTPKNPPEFRRPNNGLLPDLFNPFHPGTMETGDLLLLILLFLLSHEQADEEVLAALVALLIL